MLPEVTLVEARETTPRHYGMGLTAGRTVAVTTLTTLRNMAATELHFASPLHAVVTLCPYRHRSVPLLADGCLRLLPLAPC